MQTIREALRSAIHSIDPAPVLPLRDRWSRNRQERRAEGLSWQLGPRAPVARSEAGAAQVGPELLVFGGYDKNLGRVHSTVDVLDLRRNQWTARFEMPGDMPQTHNGVATDGTRFIYAIAGQLGIQCAPATPVSFVIDAQERAFRPLPSLPEPRYAPTVRIWHGRLHAMGGSHVDRFTAATEHWSIAVAAGRATETRWREEPPIPRGGPHRLSAVVDGVLYLLGGQEGDLKPLPGDALHRCDWSTPPEAIFADVFALSATRAEWRRLRPMPRPITHSENSSCLLNERFLVIFGGMISRNELSDEVQVYDFETDTWRVLGHLPYRLKTPGAAYYDGWFHLACGQRDVSASNPKSGWVLNSVWQAKSPL